MSGPVDKTYKTRKDGGMSKRDYAIASQVGIMKEKDTKKEYKELYSKKGTRKRKVMKDNDELKEPITKFIKEEVHDLSNLDSIIKLVENKFKTKDVAFMVDNIVYKLKKERRQECNIDELYNEIVKYVKGSTEKKFDLMTIVIQNYKKPISVIYNELLSYFNCKITDITKSKKIREEIFKQKQLYINKLAGLGSEKLKTIEKLKKINKKSKVFKNSLIPSSKYKNQDSVKFKDEISISCRDYHKHMNPLKTVVISYPDGKNITDYSKYFNEIVKILDNKMWFIPSLQFWREHCDISHTNNRENCINKHLDSFVNKFKYGLMDNNGNIHIYTKKDIEEECTIKTIEDKIEAEMRNPVNEKMRQTIRNTLEFSLKQYKESQEPIKQNVINPALNIIEKKKSLDPYYILIDYLIYKRKNSNLKDIKEILYTRSSIDFDHNKSLDMELSNYFDIMTNPIYYKELVLYLKKNNVDVYEELKNNLDRQDISKLLELKEKSYNCSDYQLTLDYITKKKQTIPIEIKNCNLTPNKTTNIKGKDFKGIEEYYNIVKFLYYTYKDPIIDKEVDYKDDESEENESKDDNVNEQISISSYDTILNNLFNYGKSMHYIDGNKYEDTISIDKELKKARILKDIIYDESLKRISHEPTNKYKYDFENHKYLIQYLYDINKVHIIILQLNKLNILYNNIDINSYILNKIHSKLNMNNDNFKYIISSLMKIIDNTPSRSNIIKNILINFCKKIGIKINNDILKLVDNPEPIKYKRKSKSKSKTVSIDINKLDMFIYFWYIMDIDNYIQIKCNDINLNKVYNQIHKYINVNANYLTSDFYFKFFTSIFKCDDEKMLMSFIDNRKNIIEDKLFNYPISKIYSNIMEVILNTNYTLPLSNIEITNIIDKLKERNINIDIKFRNTIDCKDVMLTEECSKRNINIEEKDKCSKLIEYDLIASIKLDSIIKDAISNKPFFYRDLNSHPSMSEIENITGIIVNKLFNTYINKDDSNSNIINNLNMYIPLTKKQIPFINKYIKENLPLQIENKFDSKFYNLVNYLKKYSNTNSLPKIQEIISYYCKDLKKSSIENLFRDSDPSTYTSLIYYLILTSNSTKEVYDKFMNYMSIANSVKPSTEFVNIIKKVIDKFTLKLDSDTTKYELISKYLIDDDIESIFNKIHILLCEISASPKVFMLDDSRKLTSVITKVLKVKELSRNTHYQLINYLIKNKKEIDLPPKKEFSLEDLIEECKKKNKDYAGKTKDELKKLCQDKKKYSLFDDIKQEILIKEEKKKNISNYIELKKYLLSINNSGELGKFIKLYRGYNITGDEFKLLFPVEIKNVISIKKEEVKLDKIANQIESKIYGMYKINAQYLYWSMLIFNLLQTNLHNRIKVIIDKLPHLLTETNINILFSISEDEMLKVIPDLNKFLIAESNSYIMRNIKEVGAKVLKYSNPHKFDFLNIGVTKKDIDMYCPGKSIDDVILYKEDNKIYCLSINDIMNNKYINPGTGNVLDQTFIKKITSFFKNNEEKKDEKKKVEKKEEKKKEKIKSSELLLQLGEPLENVEVTCSTCKKILSKADAIKSGTNKSEIIYFCDTKCLGDSKIIK